MKIMMKFENIREKQLLKAIQGLSDELIFKIYKYMTGKAKFICNKKYEYLERNVKDDCKKKYVFWKSLNMVFEPLPKENILHYLRKIILPNHPEVIDKVWYHYKENNNDTYYTGEDLLNLWDKDAIDIIYYHNNRIAFDNHIKMRIIDAIYYYILQNITNFTTYKKIHMNHPLYVDSDIVDSSKNFLKIDTIHRLCKSVELLSFDKNAK